MSRRNLNDADFSLMSKVAVLSAFSRDEIVSMTNGAAVVIYNGREFLFSEGEPAEQFFIVIKGQVRLFRILGDGRVTLFHLVSAGESFAEAVVLSGQRYPVSAECDPGSEIIAISRMQLVNRLRNDKEMIGRMMQSLIERERFSTGSSMICVSVAHRSALRAFCCRRLMMPKSSPSMSSQTGSG